MSAEPVAVAAKLDPEQARRVVRRYRQHLHATPDEVFPLICPVREAEWLDGFAYEMVYSASGLAEEGCVFATRSPVGEESTWVVTTHDRARRRVDFLRNTAGSYLSFIRVDLTEAEEAGCTTAEITYTFTALSDRGSRQIDEQHSQERFLEMVTTWERSLDHYLQTGEQLPLQ